MKDPVLKDFESKFIRKTALPVFKAGDTVCVWVKIAEGTNKDGSTKFRLQAFEGTCIRYRKGTTSSSFLIRKVAAGGIAVERNFMTHSPLVDRVEVKVRGKVRRSRIFYLRDLKGKAARITSAVYQGALTESAAQ